MGKMRNLFSRTDIFFLAFLIVFALASQSVVADNSLEDVNNVTVWANTNNDSTGTLTLRVGLEGGGQQNILTADPQGNTTLNLGTNGSIINAGAVSGVTTLSTSGATTLGSTLSVTGLTTLNGIDNSNGGITNAGAISGATTIDASGTITGGNLATGGTLNVTGATVLGSTLGVTGATTLGSTLDVTGATVLGSTLAVTGTTTLTGALTANGGETVHNGSAIFSGSGTGNSMVVDSASSRFVSADTFSNAAVSDGLVTLVADNDALSTNARSSLSMTPTSAGLFVNTATGQQHGIEISQTSTVISGGTTSTTLTLDDSGAKFANEATGAPVRVTGVANGVGDFDAVNMRQFRGLEDRVDNAYSGIASIAALAAIPSPAWGDDTSIGFGFGSFENQSAIAVGGKLLIGDEENITLSAGVGYCGSTTTFNAGLGWSF